MRLGSHDHFVRTVTGSPCQPGGAPADGLPSNAPTEARHHQPKRPGFVPDVWMDSRIARPGFKVTDPLPGYADLGTAR